MRRTAPTVALLAAATIALTGCGSSTSEPTPAATTSSATASPAPVETVTVTATPSGEASSPAAAGSRTVLVMHRWLPDTPGDTAEALASISVAVDGEMAESSIGEGPDMEGVKFNETFIPSKDSGPGNFHTYTLELKSGQKVSTAANVRSGLDGELECTISVVDGGVLDQMDSSDSMTGHSASCSASVP